MSKAVYSVCDRLSHTEPRMVLAGDDTHRAVIDEGGRIWL